MISSIRPAEVGGAPMRTAYGAGETSAKRCATRWRRGFVIDRQSCLSRTGLIGHDVSRNALTANGSRRGVTDKAIVRFDPETAVATMLAAMAAGTREIIRVRAWELANYGAPQMRCMTRWRRSRRLCRQDGGCSMSTVMARVELPERYRTRCDRRGSRDAPVLMFLHRFSQSHRTWRHQIAHFSRNRYRCIARDQRGYRRLVQTEQRRKKITPDKLISDISSSPMHWASGQFTCSAMIGAARLPGVR